MGPRTVPGALRNSPADSPPATDPSPSWIGEPAAPTLPAASRRPARTLTGPSYPPPARISRPAPSLFSVAVGTEATRRGFHVSVLVPAAVAATSIVAPPAPTLLVRFVPDTVVLTLEMSVPPLKLIALAPVPSVTSWRSVNDPPLRFSVAVPVPSGTSSRNVESEPPLLMLTVPLLMRVTRLVTALLTLATPALAITPASGPLGGVPPSQFVPTAQSPLAEFHSTFRGV